MPRYFGLKNISKAHAVSSFWKDTVPNTTDLRSLVELLNWDLASDIIVCGSYCDFFVYQDNMWHSLITSDAHAHMYAINRFEDVNEKNYIVEDYYITFIKLLRKEYDYYGYEYGKLVEFNGLFFFN